MESISDKLIIKFVKSISKTEPECRTMMSFSYFFYSNAQSATNFMKLMIEKNHWKIISRNDCTLSNNVHVENLKINVTFDFVTGEY